jgi:long-chain acyl-CoA synthetase
VEEVLYAHPKIQEAVVAGIPHPTRGDDTLKAFVVLKAGQSCSADELKDYCRTQLAPHKIPRDVQFRAELPKTQVGKVLRRVLVDEEKAKQA